MLFCLCICLRVGRIASGDVISLHWMGGQHTWWLILIPGGLHYIEWLGCSSYRLGEKIKNLVSCKVSKMFWLILIILHLCVTQISYRDHFEIFRGASHPF